MQLSAATQEPRRTLHSLLNDLARVPPAAHADVARVGYPCQTNEVVAARTPYRTRILRLNKLKLANNGKITHDRRFPKVTLAMKPFPFEQ